MRSRTVAATVMTFALFLPAAGFAQQASMERGSVMTMSDEPETEGTMHQGFWIGFGMGGGSLGLSGDASGLDRESGLSGNFRVGGHISPRFLVGGETNGWYKDQDGATLSVGALSLVGYFYPLPSSGFFVKGGLGYARMSVEAFGGSGAASGGSAQVGLGYDFAIGSHTALNLYTNYVATSISEDDFSLNPNFLQLGAGIAWY